MTAAWLAWGAPALACLLLLLTIPVHSAARIEASITPGFDGTNTPLYAAYRHAAEQSAQNSLAVASFAWTNLAPAPSTNASFGGAN